MQVDCLAIGVDNYFDSSGRLIRDRVLRFAASDADRVFRTVTYLFDVRHAALLTDGPQSKINPTRNAIIRIATQLGAVARDDLSTLIIYFAGHGVGIAGALHLCPSDYDWEIREHSSVGIALLCELTARRRGKTCMIFDCCRAPLSADPNMGTPRLPHILVPIGDKIAVLIGCSDGQSSFESTEIGQTGGGIFTQELLSALNAQASASRDSFLSLGQIFREARDQTIQFVFEKKGSAFQKPVALGGDIDEFLLEPRQSLR